MVLPLPNPSVVFQPVADGAVLLNTRAEIYFGLNAVGADVWQLLPPRCRTIDELCAELCRKYPEADPDEVRHDVSALLDELSGEGLVTGSPGQIPV